MYGMKPLALLVLGSCAAALAAPPPPPAFRFASSHGDNMVLAMAPAQATVWGFAPPGGAVTVGFSGQTIPTTTGTWLNQSTWLAKLPAMVLHRRQGHRLRLRALHHLRAGCLVAESPQTGFIEEHRHLMRRQRSRPHVHPRDCLHRSAHGLPDCIGGRRILRLPKPSLRLQIEEV